MHVYARVHSHLFDDFNTNLVVLVIRLEIKTLSLNYPLIRCDLRVGWMLARNYPRRRTSVVPEIRIMAPSLERGLDEVLPQKQQQQQTTTFIEPEPRMKRER